MNQPNEVRPPEWPLRFMRFFLKEEYLEEIEGDMEEAFQENVELFSESKARRIYVGEMFRLLRLNLIRNISGFHHVNPYPMYKNYFKTSLRSFMKNPLTSFINVFGLSVAIGVCILVYTFLAYDYSIDDFHVNKNKVFLTTFYSDRDGTTQRYGTTPRALGEMLKQDFPQVRKICRVEDRSVIIKQEEHVFHEHVRFVDATFLEMFTFPLKWGSAKSLGDLNSIILSEDMSVKYFGDENPLGREVLLVFDQTKKAFKVTGVAAPFPKARNIDFNFLINYENARVADPQYDCNDWKTFLNATFIQVENPVEVQAIEARMDKYKSLQNQVQPDWAITSFAFEPLATLFENSSAIKDCISTDGNVEGRLGMPIIAIFMITLACFNYINIAIVSAAKRLKEIGIRKVIGANRIRIVVQFLTENVVVTSFALIMGLALGAFIFIPWFVQFTGWPLEITLLDKNLWIFLIALLFFTGIASGLYPAFYISKFQATRIFHGSLEFGRKNPLTKIFLGVQLVLACITITTGVVFTQNNSYQRNRSWGYNEKQALYAEVPDRAAFDKLKALMLRDPNVIAVSGSAEHVGRSALRSVIRMAPDNQYEVDQIAVEAGYIETMQLQLAQGRTFVEDSEHDKRAVVVNESLVENLHLTSPIGQQFEIDSVKYEVIGVVKDFHHESFFNKVRPTMFRIAAHDDVHFLTVRVKPGKEAATYGSLQAHWGKLYPEVPFQGGHQEDVWSYYYDSLDKSVAFNRIIATVAVLLAALGLYGLVTLNVSGRVREFSIRKTLGAGMRHIAAVIINQYAVLIGVALLVGAPIAYVFTKAYLDMLFSYSMPMGYSGVVISVIILILILLGVISTQIRKVLRTNPVEGLKIE